VLAACRAVRGETAAAAALFGAAGEADEVPVAERGAWVRARLRDGGPSGPGDTVVAETLHAIRRDGATAVLGGALATVPRDLAGLLAGRTLTPAEVAHLHEHAGPVTAGDLAALAIDPTLGRGLDSALLRRVHDALPALRAAGRGIPLGRAWSRMERLGEALAERLDPAPRLAPLGSLRRFAPVVGDIEVLAEDGDDAGAASPHAAAAGELLDAVATAMEPQVLHRGRRTATLIVDDEHVTLRVAGPAERGTMRLFHTGAAGHLRDLQARASRRGLVLAPTGLFGNDEARLPCDDEAAVYGHLDLPWVAPELRHGAGEVAAAEAGALPRPVEMGDIRGDLHTHTLFSDGRDSVEAMVRAARALGYEYIAITDHSPSATASRVLSRERLARQAEDVAAARRRVEGITVLHGVEVDILPDGSLDFPDEVLAGLDLVLASLHEAAGQPPDVLLERYLTAMRHPLVTIVTHPANRMPGRDEGYALDFEALFAAAAETGTIVEVDGGPAHLDLDGALAARAAAAGAWISIDSDAHDATRLGRQMRFGVGTARRGGVTAAQVVNTRPLDDLQGLLRRKRA
jgi:DNA polymerase (family 10)